MKRGAVVTRCFRVLFMFALVALGARSQGNSNPFSVKVSNGTATSTPLAATPVPSEANLIGIQRLIDANRADLAEFAQGLAKDQGTKLLEKVFPPYKYAEVIADIATADDDWHEKKYPEAISHTGEALADLIEVVGKAKAVFVDVPAYILDGGSLLWQEQRLQQSYGDAVNFLTGKMAKPSSHSSWRGNIWGDTHILTLDGKSYDFQAVGEFVALKSTVDSLEVQVRQAPWGTSRTASITSAVAINVEGDRVGVYLGEAGVRINGAISALGVNSILHLPNGGWIEWGQNQFFVEWRDSTVLRIDVSTGYLSAFVDIPETRRARVAGLYGNFDNNAENDLMTRQGVPINTQKETQYFYALYHQFGASWRVSQSESLFDYAPRKTTRTFTDLTFPDAPLAEGDILGAKRQMAERQCRAAGLTREPFFTACVLDVAVTGDLSFAKASLQTAARTNLVQVGAAKTGKPAVSVNWAGSNAVGIDLVDSTQKLKVGGFVCGGGQTCVQNVAAGNYFLRVNAPGFDRLIPVTVASAGATEVDAQAGIISLHWAGANAVGIDIVDSTQKFKVGGLVCGGGQTCKQDAAAGSYFLKINAPGFDKLIPVAISASATAGANPPAGVFAFHWTGANAVGVDVVDSTQKFKVGGLVCGGGQICKQDAAAGSYFLKINAPGFDKQIPVTVPDASTVDITPPAGVISIHWTGTNAVGIDIADSTQKFKVGGLVCGGGQTCKQDAAAGTYFLKINAPGINQLIPIAVTAGRVSDATF
jgi:hypothetical protein